MHCVKRNVLNKLCTVCYNGRAVQHSDKSSIAQYCAISTVLKVVCYKDSADQQSTKTSCLAQCCLTRCCLAQFQYHSANTLFWRKLQYVAKYALFVLFFSLQFVSVLFFTLFPSLQLTQYLPFLHLPMQYLPVFQFVFLFLFIIFLEPLPS